MPSKSKNKGNNYERDVARFLSEIYEESFVKSPGSGAFVGGSNTHRKSFLSENQIKSFKGDVIPPDDWNYFHCEGKWYQEFPFHLLFHGNMGLLDGWIDQVREAEEPGDFNLICIKINYKGQWICVEQKHGFKIKNSLDYKEWLFCRWENFWTDHNINLVKQLSVQGSSFE